MSGALALLRRRPRFRALWAAIALSYSGSGAATTARTVYVPETHGTGAALAAFLIAAAGGLITLAVASTMLRAPAVGTAAEG